jgi:hypothetical protein
MEWVFDNDTLANYVLRTMHMTSAVEMYQLPDAILEQLQ